MAPQRKRMSRLMRRELIYRICIPTHQLIVDTISSLMQPTLVIPEEVLYPSPHKLLFGRMMYSPSIRVSFAFARGLLPMFFLPTTVIGIVIRVQRAKTMRRDGYSGFTERGR